MEFLKKLITKKTQIEQPLNEKEEVVEVEVAPVRIGDYLLFVMKFFVEDKELRDFQVDRKGGGNTYSQHGGKISEFSVGIIDQKNKRSYRADIYLDTPLDTDEIGPESLNGSHIDVLSTPNGPRQHGSQRIEDTDLEQFLQKLVSGYLTKNLDSVIRSTFGEEFEPNDERNRRSRPDYD